jgi:hypothetical protein
MKETDLYVKDVDKPEDGKIFFSLSELKNAGENINDYYIIKVAVLNNPGFTKIESYKYIKLETGNVIHEENEIVLPTTVKGFYEEVKRFYEDGFHGIIDNTAIIAIPSEATMKRDEYSKRCYEFTFDDGTKLTFYKAWLD